MIKRWFHTPELHSPGHGHERKVGWLELFYDLIYVATIIQLGNALAANVSVLGFLGFAGLFAPIWLLWTGFTFYSNRFVVDDALHRASVFVQMFAVGAMAVSVPLVYEGQPLAFGLSYALARFVLVGLYARVWRQVPKTREMTRRLTMGFAVGAVIWTVTSFLPAPWVFVGWGVAFAIDLFIPLSRQSREITARFPPDVLHFSERYGLLTIIVLGESFVKVLSEVAARGAELGTGGLAALTLLITCSLWWIYFDDVAGSRIKNTRLAPFAWVYTHLPMMIAVTAVGVAAKKVVFFDPMAVELTKYRWLLCGSLGLAFLSVGLIDAVTERRQAELSDRARVNVRLFSAVLILLLAPAGGFMPAWVFVAMVAAACVIQVLFDLSMAPEFADPEMAEEDQHYLFGSGHPEEEEEEVVDPGRPIRRDVADAIRKGTPNELRRDLYFHLMDGPWSRVLIGLGVAFFFVNVVFAALYLLEPDGVSSLHGGSFLEALSFSVQTFTTIGYGTMSPVSTYAHAVSIIEAGAGLLFVAMATGLIFAKASRPASAVLFSNGLVVNEHHGAPTLKFRVGNARGNDIVEATLKVAVLIEEESPEGHRMRRLHDLKLVRDMSPLFALSWTVMHVLDETSPLHGLSEAEVHDRLTTMVVTMTGYDATYAQQTHARKIYYPEHIRFEHRFVDTISFLDDGRLQIDYDVFHDTVPVEGD